MTQRIRVVGPESAGKTTLARTLSGILAIPWVEEFARRHLADRGPQPTLTAEDFVAIARGQAAAEDAATAPVVLCDTDPTLTRVWAETLLGFVPPEVVEIAAERSYALTLLVHPRADWTPDDLRYQPEQAARARFLRRCRQLYPDAVELQGPDELRRRIALERCRALL